jgi:hypothetical protein
VVPCLAQQLAMPGKRPGACGRAIVHQRMHPAVPVKITQIMQIHSATLPPQHEQNRPSRLSA